MDHVTQTIVGSL